MSASRIVLTCLVCASFLLVTSLASAQSLTGRAVWGHPGILGKSRESIAEFADAIAGANINTLVMMVKGVRGEIYYPSEQFPESVARGYEDFEMPAILIDECHKRGIEVHAWFCDFPDGPNSYVNQQHPEWAMRNKDNETTDSEILRGSQYGMRWMCPARRPGYTDQWLIPMITEFATKYDIDAIHHDYVRYPGDLAPDIYCFCEYCLEEIPRFAGYYKESFPDEAFHHPTYDRPYLEAHWEPGPRVLPENWDSMPHRAKSRFLLEGAFFAGGRADLDYFFYRYRIHHITRFTREVAESVHAVKPDVEFSAAVFKNPLHSGRFIGQDWREFTPWVEYIMPMDYRFHYPGTFEQHLTLLDESIRMQIERARDAKHFWPGIASYQLYAEENAFHRAVRQVLDGSIALSELADEWEATAPSLQESDPGVQSALNLYFSGSGSADAATRALQTFIDKHPTSYRPSGKFIRTLETVKGTGVDGLVVFAIGDVMRNGLLDDLGAFFAK